MRSMFIGNGIRNARETSWMGQTAPQASSTDGWGAIATGIKSGADAFKSYEQEQIAEEQRRAEEQKRAAAEAAARTAQIQQTTTALQLQAAGAQNKIMGIDKPVFYVGAALLLLVVGGFAWTRYAK